jgi:TolB-like protein/DNA-binding winged helix-turn-helix (wHTH) protein/Tfp pilus assembly protein PilF
MSHLSGIFALNRAAPVTSSEQTKRRVRFGAFEADLQAGELCKHGARIRLQDQPFQILAMLLGRPGDVVTREELREQLWPSDTFVDFDHGLNNAVNRLREALRDSAEIPRYIETLPKRGYRFIAPLADVPVSTSLSATQVSSSNVDPRRTVLGQAGSAERIIWPSSRARFISLSLGTLFVLAVGALLIGLNAEHFRDRFFRSTNVPQIRSLAVLPLENLSGDPAQEYFADGMTDALITDLAQIGALRVISRTSVMQFKGAKKSLPQIAAELKVDAVVEGTVMRSGNQVRIDAQLIRAATDQHLWAQSYEGDTQDALQLQSKVASAIAAEIEVKLTPQETARFASQPAVNPEAYGLYLRGLYSLDQRTEKEMRKALGYFQQAVEKDPSSALAYSGLSDACSLLGAFGFLPKQEADSKARAAAIKAVELDGSSAHALTSLAAQTDSDAQAEQLYKRAIALNPGYAQAHHWYARFLSERQRLPEALAEIQQAQSLDPLSVRIVDNVGEILLAMGDNDGAARQFQQALVMDPSFPPTHFGLGVLYFYTRSFDSALHQFRAAIELNPHDAAFHYRLAVLEEFLGKYPEAIPEFQKAELIRGGNPKEVSARMAALRHALAASGESGYWREWVTLRIKDREKSPHAYAYNIAYDYAHLGEKDEVFKWFEICHREGTCGVEAIRFDPGLDPVRSDPRFPLLLQRWGLSNN